jgi:hypothetical protein
MRAYYTICFRTSFLQGAGSGVPGLMDDISVSADGVPFVQGDGVAHELRRNLRNMWAGQEQLLCEGQQATPIDPGKFCCRKNPCLYCRMFGRPKDLPRSWDVDDAHLPKDTEKAIRDAIAAAPEWEVFVRHARTAIDHERRRAEENLLFALGRAVPFGKFRGSVNYVGPGNAPDDQKKAIQLGFRLIRGIGRAKKRGVGEVAKCCLGEWFESAPGVSTTVHLGDSGVLQSAKLRITLTTETGFPSRHLHGNEYDTLPYIPGRAIWGALAALLGLQPGKPCDEEVMHLLYEDIRVWNALPGRGQTLPMPLSARRDKSQPVGANDEWGAQCGAIKDFLLDGHPSNGEWVPVGKAFVVPGEQGVWAPHEVKRVWRGHNTQRPPRGQGGADDSAFFATEVLASGQVFECWLDCTDKRSAELFGKLVSRLQETGSMRLKGHHQEVSVPNTGESGSWTGDVSALQDPLVTDEQGKARVWLTLLSPALIQDPWGRAVSVLSGDWLAQKIPLCKDKVRLVRHFSALTPVLGDSGAWGLPLTPELGLAAGSAFLYEVTPDKNTVCQLKELSRLGIGRRRCEGFGQVLVNWDFHSTAKVGGAHD